jgi:hypothetical protein
MKLLALLAIVATVLSGLAEAQQAYKWTDANGQVHYGDAPPLDSKAEAKAIDLIPTVSEQERKNAQERLIRDKADLKKVTAADASAGASAASGVSSASNPSSPAPQTCAQQWKAYNESYACMDPYRVGGANGNQRHVLPEGFVRCGNVPEPVDCPLSHQP